VQPLIRNAPALFRQIEPSGAVDCCAAGACL